MDFNDTKEEAQFREEVNNWLSKNAEKKQHARDIYKAAGIPGDGTALQDAKKWQEKLYDAGWACLHWPKDYGGRDASPMERVIWARKCLNIKFLAVISKLAKEWLVPC